MFFIATGGPKITEPAPAYRVHIAKLSHLFVPLDDLQAEVVLLVEPQVRVRHDVQRVDHAPRRLGSEEGHLMLRATAAFGKSGSLQSQELIVLEFRKKAFHQKVTYVMHFYMHYETF